MNILLLTKEEEDTNRANILELWLNEIPKLGNKIFWVTSDKKVKRNYKPNVYLCKFKNNIKGFSFSRRVNDFICKMIVSSKILRKKRIDAIHVRNGIMESLIAMILSRLHGIKFSFHYSSMHGFWEFQFASWRNLFIKNLYLLRGYVKRFIYLYILTNCYRIDTISKGMNKILIKKGFDQEKILTTPICISEKSESVVNNSFKDFSKDKRYIAYVGSPGPSRNPIFLLDIIKILNKSARSIVLLVIGGTTSIKNKDPHLNDLISLSKRMKLSNNVIFTGQISIPKMYEYINYSDICISPIPPKLFFKISSPSKVLDYFSMSKPVIANSEILDHVDILKNSRGGLLVPYDSELFARAILHLLDNQSLSKKMGKMGYKWIINNRNYRHVAERVVASYER